MKNIIIFSLLSVFTLAACSHKEQPPVENTKTILSDTMMSMIRIDSVRTCNIDDEVSLNGQVSFNENNVVKIFPRSSGQITESRVSLGDKVSKGQVLATIKSADIAGNYSDLSSANADLAIAKRQMDNAESLYKSGISSEREYTEAKQNYEKALAAKNKVSSTLSINGGTKSSANGQYQLTSPIDGYVVEKKVAAGGYIRPDMGDYLFTISDLKTIWIYANVYEADIPRIKQGYSVKVTTLAYPDKVFSGKIDNVSEVLDAQSKALRARISLDNSEMLLKPDMFAKVMVSNEEGAHALCIPTNALISQDGKSYVVIYNSREDVKVAEVTIVKTVGDRTYIDAGLTAGQHVITQNQLLIFNQLISSDTK
ncbi:MAG: efflux RND transporter periplasmic adaptor subunit [Flavipsychrobacter sp.]|nr:efflux RND transporter periplasmic adaptor subunit [Flavipsychrobacter sp.]